MFRLHPDLDEIPPAIPHRMSFRTGILSRDNRHPGFMSRPGFDIFPDRAWLAAFTHLHARVGNQASMDWTQRHNVVYETQIAGRRDQVLSSGFDHWLKGESPQLMSEPASSIRRAAWVADQENYVAMIGATRSLAAAGKLCTDKFYLTGDGRLSADGPEGEARRLPLRFPTGRFRTHSFCRSK